MFSPSDLRWQDTRYASGPAFERCFASTFLLSLILFLVQKQICLEAVPSDPREKMFWLIIPPRSEKEMIGLTIQLSRSTHIGGWVAMRVQPCWFPAL